MPPRLPACLPACLSQPGSQHSTPEVMFELAMCGFRTATLASPKVKPVQMAQNRQTLQRVRKRKALELDSEGIQRPLANEVNGRESAMQKIMSQHFLHVCRDAGPGFRFSLEMTDSNSSDTSVYLKGLPDLLQCPCGRTPLEIPISSSLVEPHAAETMHDDIDRMWDKAEEEPPIISRVNTVHMTVVHAHVGAMRLLHMSLGSGQRLKDNDLVVSVNRAVTQAASADHVTYVIARPQHIGISGGNTLGVLSALSQPTHVLRDGVKAWEERGVAFLLRGVVAVPDYIDAVTELVRSGAYPQGRQPVQPLLLPKNVEARDRERLQALDELVARAPHLVAKVDDTRHHVGFKLTQQALQEVEMLDVRAQPSYVFATPSVWPVFD